MHRKGGQRETSAASSTQNAAPHTNAPRSSLSLWPPSCIVFRLLFPGSPSPLLSPLQLCPARTRVFVGTSQRRTCTV